MKNNKIQQKNTGKQKKNVENYMFKKKRSESRSASVSFLYMRRQPVRNVSGSVFPQIPVCHIKSWLLRRG